MILLMRPGVEEIARTTGGAHPRWFAAPVFAADGAARFASTFGDLRSTSRTDRRKRGALVFNVGRLESCLSLLSERALPLCSLYQWRPLEAQQPLKRWLYRRVLGRSRVLVTYSRQSEIYLRNLFPGKPVVWLGHFIDTEFFQPANRSDWREPYFLCVGNHKRYEGIIVRIAEETKTPFIRVSSDPKVAGYHSANPSSWVKVHQDVEFTRLRQYYQEAELVLNIVDDSQWPVGITSFCEALSMNCSIVTSGAHSCSGYSFTGGAKPYLTVDSPQDPQRWLAAIQRARAVGRNWSRGHTPRDLALTHCSFDVARETWSKVISLLESGE
ncbi:MAG: glycosyltransferase [Acidobacteria bacterium]|nr:glycosyltransferase [Acidobacteriota bacterium]